MSEEKLPPEVLALPIFPVRLQTSIFGASELNFRVRDGNGWTLTAINTNLLSCEQESKQRKLSWTTTLRQCLLLPLLSYSPLYKERSRSGSQAFELCRLRVLRNCFVLPFSKSSTNHFCFPLLLALHTWLLCSVFKVRFQLLSKPDPNTQSP